LLDELERLLATSYFLILSLNATEFSAWLVIKMQLFSCTTLPPVTNSRNESIVNHTIASGQSD